jgi:hypothetical protein
MNVVRLLLCIAVAAAVSASPVCVAQAPAAGQQPGSDITPTPEQSQSPWGWLKMPTITMPKITMPKMPADPLAPIKSSAKKVSDGGKKAWEGTKEIFRGGKAEEPTARVANASEAPSLWDRMTGNAKEPEPQGPATVTEWMKQPRVGEE